MKHSRSHFRQLIVGSLACLLIAPVQSTSAQTGQVNPDTSPVEKIALIIAVRDYSNSTELAPLIGTNRDAEHLRNVLIKSGYLSRNVELIYDDAQDPSMQPRRANILAAVQRVVLRATKNDELLVVTTSHGITLNGESYLCPSDVNDDALYGSASEKLISVKAVTDQLSKCPAENKLFVVDACRDVSRSRTEGFVAAMQKPPEGVWLMSSCSESQSSYMSPALQEGESHAVFSYYFTEGLSGAADLLGNYDGKISIAELQTYTYLKTREECERLNVSQTPELFGGLAAMYTVSTVANYVPNKLPTTGDPDVERRQTCALIASSAVQKINATQQRQVKQFVEYQKSGLATHRMQSLHQETYREMCYILGNYLTPALELDRDSKLAHLGRGHIFRSSGLYQEAAESYASADEHFELYAMNDPQKLGKILDQHYITTSNSTTSDETTRALENLKLAKIGLRSEPNSQSGISGSVSPHSKIRIGNVSTDSATDEQWLLVTSIDDVDLATSGWISRENVVWFKEAADVYTPNSPMTKRGGGMPTALTRIDNTANRMYALADRLDEPGRRINQVADNFDNSGAGRGLAIAGRFAPVPNIGGYIRRGAGYANIPGSYVRRAGSYTQMPANYARSYGAGSGYAGAYRAGLERSAVTDDQRKEMISLATLDAVVARPVHVSLVPWSEF